MVVVRDLGDRARLLRDQGDAVATRLKGACVAVKIADCVPVLVGDRAERRRSRDPQRVAGTGRTWSRPAIAGLRDEIAGAGRSRRGDWAPYRRVLLRSRRRRRPSVAGVPSARERDRARLRPPPARRPAQDRARPALGLGISEANIDEVPGCTKCDEERFFSFRRDREKSGRLLAAIVAR